MPRVVHFEFSAEDPEKLSDFYREAFGWTITKNQSTKQDYWFVVTGMQSEKGINGGIKKKGTPGHGTIASVEVKDIEATLKAVENAGGKRVGELLTLPGTGVVSYCQDPEGNFFCVIEYRA